MAHRLERLDSQALQAVHNRQSSENPALQVMRVARVSRTRSRNVKSTLPAAGVICGWPTILRPGTLQGAHDLSALPVVQRLAAACRMEQSFSPDGGQSWETIGAPLEGGAPLLVRQAAAASARRERSPAPRAPRPIAINAQLAGSGTGSTTPTTSPLKILAGK